MIENTAWEPAADPAGLPGRLRLAWEVEPPVELGPFLGGLPPLPPTALAEVVAVDQDERWRRGGREPAEAYFECFPALCDSPEAALRVVYGELLARTRLGEAPTLDSFQARFPWLAELLALQWEVHDALNLASSTVGVSSGESSRLEPEGYEVFEEIGRGALGVVYRARHRRLDRLVALKVLRDAPLSNPEDGLRFFEEARLTARLSHPHIVRVYDVGRHEGWPYIALELLTGGSLAAKLNGQVLPPREAARLLHTLAGAVESAHRAGVVHRDLKPANILFDERGEPQITDFGLAKHGAGGGYLTGTGAVLGTPAYMAPEQARGVKGIGPAADVYSLGAILYETLTGRPPLVGATFADTLLLVTRQLPASPRAVNGLVPRDLAAVCLKCLEKPPARRYPSAEALALDLGRFLDGKPTLARPRGPLARSARWARLNPLPAALAGAAGAALMAGAALSSHFALRALGRARDAREAERVADRLLGDVSRAREDEARARRHAEEALDRAEWLVYAGTIQAANRERQGGDPSKARDTLNATRWDFRGEEFGLVAGAAQGRVRQLFGHTDAVRAASFRADGQRLATGGDDRIVRIWEGDNPRLVSSLGAAPAAITCLRFDAGGDTLAVAGEDGFLTVWDVAARRPLLRWRHGPGAVSALARGPRPGVRFAAGPDGPIVRWDGDRRALALTGHDGPALALDSDASGRTLASAGADGTARVWDAESGRSLAVHRGAAGALTAIALSADGKTLAVGDGRLVRVWSVGEAGPGRALAGHTGEVRALAFAPELGTLLSGAKDNTVRAWDLATGSGRVAFTGASGGVNGLAVAPGGGAVAVAAGSPTVNVVSVAEGADRVEVPVAVLDHFQIAFSPDGHEVAAPLADGGLGVWEAATGRPLRALPGFGGQSRGVCYAPGGDALLVGGEDGVVRVWGTAGESPRLAVKQGLGGIYALAHHPTLPEVAVACQNGAVTTFDTATGATARAFEGHKGIVPAVAYTPDGTRLVTAGMDKSLRVWDRATGTCLRTIPAPRPAIRLAVSPDGTRLASVTWADTFDVWDLRTGQSLALVYGHDRTLRGVAFTPDGKRVVTASEDGTVRFWHGQSYTELLTLGPRQGLVTQLALSPDGSWLAEAGDDGRLRVWYVRPEDAIKSVHPNAGGVTGAAFRHDGKVIVSVTRTGVIQLWDAASGRLRRVLPGHRGEAAAAAFAPVGTTLATAGVDGLVRLWDSDSGEPLARLGQGSVVARRLTFSPDGARLAAIREDDRVTVWDVASGTATDPGVGDARCHDFAWSPDGRRFARSGPAGVSVGGPPGPAGDRRLDTDRQDVQALRWGPNGGTLFGLTSDGVVLAWDVATGALKRQWPAHTRAGTALAVSPDGRGLLTGGEDVLLKFWDAETGALRHEVSCHSGPVLDVAFSPDGRRVLSTSEDTTMKVIDLREFGLSLAPAP